MKLTLFEFIDALFDKVKFASIPDSEKKAHFFMAQRFLSIKYPIETDNFNMLRVNQIEVINFWHKFLSSTYTRKPSWMYTKTKKSDASKKKDKIDKFDNKLIKFWLRKKRIDIRDFEFMKEIMPDELLEEFKKLEKIGKENNINFDE